MSGRRLPGVGILVSGRGTNMEALVRACARGEVPAEVRVVVSNRARAPALQRARAVGVPVAVVRRRDHADQEAFEAALVDVLRAHGVTYVCLAGFMRILGRRFLSAFPGRVLNVHPSLLPAFAGLDAPAQALAHGVKVSGCTVHLVTEQVDAGPIVAQAAVPVRDDDTPETLAARILVQEHRIFPMALRWLVEGRLQVDGRRVRCRDAGAQEPADGR